METVCKATLERTFPPDVQEDAIHNKACTVCLSAVALYMHVDLRNKRGWKEEDRKVDRQRNKKEERREEKGEERRKERKEREERGEGRRRATQQTVAAAVAGD